MVWAWLYYVDRVYKQIGDANTSHVLHKFSFVPPDYSTVTYKQCK